MSNKYKNALKWAVKINDKNDTALTKTIEYLLSKGYTVGDIRQELDKMVV